MLVKAFRMFVSSTFADFAAERGILQRELFPALDAYCTAKGYQFYPIDLRWGVNEEAQLDHRTAEICLGEVRAAKQDYPPPNVLIMIGNRYGFVPLPYAIAQDEFEAIIAWLEGQGRRDAVHSLGAVYQRDDNYLVPRGLSGRALTSAYTLRSRVDEVPELRSAEEWAKREAELRAILQEAANVILQPDAAAQKKYFLSLTEQEIICGLLESRSGIDTPFQPSPGTDDPPAIAFMREIVTESDTAASAIRHYFEEEPRLELLKDRIRHTLSADHIVIATAVVDQDGKFSKRYLENFAAQIESKLKFAIDRHIARIEAKERTLDFALTSEREAHVEFGKRKREIFIGREKELAAIARYCAGAGEQPLVLHGRSGLGKSALMARAIADAEAAAGPPVIYRFIGASAASSSLRALFVSIIEDLAAYGIVAMPGEFEQDANKFYAQIEKLLSSITSPAIVFLDALDQLQKPHDLGWLPAKLPKALKLVVSVLDDAAYAADSGLYRDLKDRLAPDAFLEIEWLSLAQGREILSALQQQSGHRLQDSQCDYIIRKFEQAGASPLYVRSAFEIARSWKSYHRAGKCRFVLADDTEGLIAQFIAELSSIHHHEAEVVTRTLGCLVAAKNGLSAKELTDILSRDTGVMGAISSERFGAQTDKLPPSVWVRLNRDLSPFLVEKQIDDQPLLQFFHRQVAQVAHAQHYERYKTELHAALAAYFESQATQLNGKTVYGKRSLSELPYQLDRSDNTSRLGEILMSPDWMQQKLAAFGVRPLIDDYQYARTRAQQLAGQALELAAGPLGRDERQLAAQIIGRISADLVDDPGEDTAIDSLLKKARALVTPPALVPRWQSLTAPGGPEIRRFEGHTGYVNAVALSPDGRYIVSGSGYPDNTLRLWEAASGREIARFEAHTRDVMAVAFSPDGRHIVSGSGDRTLRLWEVASGRELACFNGHWDWVTGVAFSPDGRYIVSGSDDGTLRLWDWATGREVTRFEGHTRGVSALAFSSDGRHIVSGAGRESDWCAAAPRDNTLRLWEAASGREVARFEGHTDSVNAVAFSPDGRYIVSGSGDRTLRLWDVSSGQSRRFDGHAAPVPAVAFSPDGRQIVSGSGDGTLRLWEAASAREVAHLECHGGVTAVAFSPDGRYIVSGSNDTTLRLWEPARAASGHETAGFEGHAESVRGVAFSPDGRHIVSGSIDKTLRLWEAASGREVARFEDPSAVEAVAFAPDGRHVVSGSADTMLRVWEVASGQSRCFEGHTSPVTAVAFSPNGRHIASGSYDNTLRIWELTSGQSRIFATRNWVLAVGFSPDGRHIVSGSIDKTLRLWEAASGREVARFEGHTDLVDAVAFSPDGRYIASGSMDHTLRLWEAPSGREIARFEGHTGVVAAVAFSPDGRYIVSGSGDETLRLWEVASGRELARFASDSLFRCLALAPTGNSLAAGDNGGRVHLIGILVDEADKAIWLRGLASGGGPTKPATPHSAASWPPSPASR
jgi:WD40 repeat protein/ribosomal protein L9